MVDRRSNRGLYRCTSGFNHAIDELEVEWHINGTVLCPRALASNNQSICTVTIPEGPLEFEPHTIRKCLRKTQLNSPSSHRKPQLGTFEPLSTHGTTAMKSFFSATVSDAEDSPDSLQVEWESTIDGTLSISNVADSSSSDSDFTNLSEGNHGITLRVTDSSDGTSQTTTTITVGPPNTPPTCSIVSPLDGTMVILESITLESQVDDPDIGPEGLSIVWRSDLDGELCSDSADSTGSQRCEVTAVCCFITNLRVEDERACCIQNAEVTVSSPPEIVILAPSQASVINENSSVTVELQVTDPEIHRAALHSQRQIQSKAPHRVTTRQRGSAASSSPVEHWRSRVGLYSSRYRWP